MTPLLDVVNFNADASCLSADEWLRALEGGRSSAFCNWLGAFVGHDKKVVLGLVGATVADLRRHNPDAIALINAHPDVFQMVLRPFAHDVALLRSPAGFLRNFELGREILRESFEHVVDYYLPPEFMLASSQLSALVEGGVRGVFINGARFRPEIQACIPDGPYRIEGVLGRQSVCVPLAGGSTRAYLDALHRWDGDLWNRAIESLPGDVACTWRDGESWLLVPRGLEREQHWLATESPAVQRVFVDEVIAASAGNLRHSEVPGLRSYPVHSFADWFKEFRMVGYLRRVQDIEARLQELEAGELALWLQVINSDVLSSVEKESPMVQIVEAHDRPDAVRDWVIQRRPRGFEGDEYLTLLERFSSPEVRRYIEENPRAHMVKLRARIDYLGSRVGRLAC